MLGALINGVSNLIGNAQQNSYNRDLAEYQNQWNLEQWNRQNEYNSPKATMQRLLEAGINPRSTNGLQSYANASDGPQAAEYSKTAPLSAFSDIAKTALEFQQMKAATQKLQSDKVKSDSEAAAAQAKALDIMSQTSFRGKQFNLAEDQMRIAILDAMRRAWQEGDFLTGTGMFNTHMPELTFDQEAFGISSLRKINENELVRLKGSSEEVTKDLRDQQKQLNQTELDFIKSIPKEARWITELFLRIFKS